MFANNLELRGDYKMNEKHEEIKKFSTMLLDKFLKDGDDIQAAVGRIPYELQDMINDIEDKRVLYNVLAVLVDAADCDPIEKVSLLNVLTKELN